MLSVLNRGSVTGSDDGIPFKIAEGYSPCYDGEYLETIKVAGIDAPFFVDITPIIKTGYTAITVDPTEG